MSTKTRKRKKEAELHPGRKRKWEFLPQPCFRETHCVADVAHSKLSAPKQHVFKSSLCWLVLKLLDNASTSTWARRARARTPTHPNPMPEHMNKTSQWLFPNQELTAHLCAPSSGQPLCLYLSTSCLLEGQSQVASLILGLVYGRTHTPIGCQTWVRVHSIWPPSQSEFPMIFL
jgi:hypothetical protein